MGASTSACLSADDIEWLRSSESELVCFSTTEIHQLYQRFQELDRKQRGVLSTADLQLIPELAMNPLCHRIISLMDADRSDAINFKQFIQALHVFHPKCEVHKKLEAAFRVYDVTDDGKLSESDLVAVLKMMAGSNLSEEQLREIVRQTIKECDTDGKGFLTLQDFCSNIKDKNKAARIMTISFRSVFE